MRWVTFAVIVKTTIDGTAQVAPAGLTQNVCPIFGKRKVGRTGPMTIEARMDPSLPLKTNTRIHSSRRGSRQAGKQVTKLHPTLMANKTKDWVFSNQRFEMVDVVVPPSHTCVQR